jgi:preprotein translocase subunit SecD
VATLAVFAGCQTTEQEKARSSVRIHIEGYPDTRGFTIQVPVYRAKPVGIYIQKSPFLTEANVEKAEIVEALGGFAIQIRFNESGGRLLEQYTLTNPGKHMAIFSQFGMTAQESRWLAAPLIAKRITDATLVFTPDCTREEAERIVLGINNSVEETKRLNLIK